MTSRDAALPSPRTRVGLTQNFDGVLNTGDSWVARRRASEASLKSTVGTSREQGDQFDNKALEIREEEEDGSHQRQSTERAEEKLNVSPSPFQTGGAASMPNNPTVTTNMAHLSIGANGSPVPEPLDNHASNGPPPGIPDLASVEWSYKDPSGQVQGTCRFL
jgi:PERQ amino acid-rich with GYF domain-containing protein